MSPVLRSLSLGRIGRTFLLLLSGAFLFPVGAHVQTLREVQTDTTAALLTLEESGTL